MAKKKVTKRVKMKLKKGDTVMVIAGSDKGKKGEVKLVDAEKHTVIVDQVRMVTKHRKPTQQEPEGGIVKMEAPIHISNVMLIDPKGGEPTRIGRRREEGKIVRYAKASGETIK